MAGVELERAAAGRTAGRAKERLLLVKSEREKILAHCVSDADEEMPDGVRYLFTELRSQHPSATQAMV